MARLALAAAIAVAVAVPAQALAQFGGPGQFPTEDYGPGITVSGVGFAPLGARDRATARAVGDARRRAEAIAAALGVSIGEARAVELSTPFEPRPACRRSQTGRCAPLDAVSVETTFAISGGPASDEDAREISGSGLSKSPLAEHRKTSPAIRRSLRAARLAAGAGAAQAARANAQAAATASGIPLGPLFSVVEPNYGYEPLLGSFGPGQFCGLVRRAFLRRDPKTGERRVVRQGPTRRCYDPKSTFVRLDVEYLGG
jgi:Protein of unknown function (DUF541)